MVRAGVAPVPPLSRQSSCPDPDASLCAECQAALDQGELP